MNSLFEEVRRRLEERAKRTHRTTFHALIVDDEEPIRKFVERVLQSAGFQTKIASDGPEALDVASKMDSLDILVTDLMMPQMNGDELARQMRVTEPDLRVLYLTAYSDRLFADKMILWDNEAFLDKPCTVNGLLEAVSLLLSGHLKLPGTPPSKAPGTGGTNTKTPPR